MLRVMLRTGELACHFVDALRLDGDIRSSVMVLDQECPPSDGAYVCVVSVGDFWRVLPSSCAEQGVSHYSTWLEPAILRDLRDQRALLLLDLCNEGPQFEAAHFDAIHVFLDSNQIPRRQAIWLSQNRSIQESYASFYQPEDVDHIRFAYYDYFIKRAAHLLASQRWQVETFGADSRYLEELLDLRNKQRYALCLNGTPRHHRLLMVSALHYYKLFEDCLISCGCEHRLENQPADIDGLQAVMASSEYRFLTDSYREILAMGEVRIDHQTSYRSELVDRVDPQVYRATYFSIVTETDFSDGTIDRITEKSVKAFGLGHPVLVAGNPHSIARITDLGFQDFAPLIPTDYDQILAPELRFSVLLSSVLSQVVCIQDNAQSWLDSSAEISRYNYHYATGGGLSRTYRDRIEAPLIESLTGWLATGHQHAGHRS